MQCDAKTHWPLKQAGKRALVVFVYGQPCFLQALAFPIFSPSAVTQVNEQREAVKATLPVKLCTLFKDC